MLATRILTAAVGIPIILGLAYAGGYWWDGGVVLIAVLCSYELMRMADNRSKVLMAGVGIATALLVLAPLMKTVSLPYWWPLGAMVIIIVTLLKLNYRIDAIHLGWAFFSTFYIGYLLSFAVAINHSNENTFINLLSVFLLTWASDTGAYFAGRFFGKRKLSPSLSPNKTWEGSLGGVLTTMVVAWALLGSQLGWPAALLIGLVASILAQIGDMFESLIKRYYGVKDSGKLLPGHGGILDRFDSFLLVVPLIYYFLT